ncbi:MAG: aldehyde dehydrogenase family protein, partial [Pseudomonadota bacterium]
MALLDYTLPTDGLAGSFIDGTWHWPESGDTLPVENPSRRKVICRIGRGTEREIDLAVAAATRARTAWAARP